MKLRNYQRDAIDRIWLAFQGGQTRLLMQSATGTGKTVTVAALRADSRMAYWLATFPARERRTLVIAHREELIVQAAAKFQAANPDLLIGVEMADSIAGPLSDVVVASIQTLSARNYARLERLMRYGVFRFVWCDEAHHASSASYRNALVRLGFLPPEEQGDEDEPDAAALASVLREWEVNAPKDRLLLGVTATPNRTDGVGLGCVFQSIVVSYPLKAAVDDGWLAEPKAFIVDTHTNLDNVAIRRGEFDQKQLAAAVNTVDRNRLAVAGWKQYADGRPTIAFTVDVEHAHKLAEEFQAYGVDARAMSGDTPKDERRDLLVAFQKRQFPVITNCALFLEGTDLPLTSCILMAKPTKSATLYEQAVGRGLRKIDGKTDCLILDVVDVSRKHSLQTAPVLYGLPPVNPNGKSLRALSDEIEQIRGQFPGMNLEAVLTASRMTLEQLKARAEKFDVWGVPELGAIGADLSLNWIKVGDDRYWIQYPWLDGQEVLRVEKDMIGKFAVVVTHRSSGALYGYARRNVGTPMPSPVRQRTLAMSLDGAKAALKTAEDFVRTQRDSVMKLRDKKASWRQAPATPAQLSALRRRGVPIPPGMTKGRASDLFDVANARMAR